MSAYDRCIVNVGVGGHYPGLQAKVAAACALHCPEAERLFRSDYPIGCPPHNERQYAFKIFALEEALAQGYRYVLWMDCTFIPVAPLMRLWREIKETGWYVPRQYQSVLGTWSTDSALNIFEIDRETAFSIPLAFSGIVGIDTRSEIGSAIWWAWRCMYLRGAFNGPHFNRPDAPFEVCGNKFSGHCSNDPRVEGHRHDEAALSFVLWKLGLVPKELGFLTLESPDGFIGRTCR